MSSMPTSTAVSGIILAAGFSRRMGSAKPLLSLGRQTVVQRVVSIYQDAGVTDIRVVTGPCDEKIRAALKGRPVACIPNPRPEDGMFASVVAGVGTIPSETEAFFIHPVDIPLVRPHTLGMLMDAAHTGSAPVIYPTFEGRRGHPPLIDRRLQQAVLDHGGRNGLRGLLDRFADSAREVPVADEGILLDMDTPADYQRLVARWKGSGILTKAECRALMRHVRKVPATVDDHCRQVARVAGMLAEGVNAASASLNVPLVRAAARVHDCARLEKSHAAAGARLLEAMGFPALANIVALHMDIPAAPDSDLDEIQIVHLADKLVGGSQVVGLSRRFAAKLEKIGPHSDAVAIVEQRHRAAEVIQAKVERLAGKPILQLLKDECQS